MPSPQPQVSADEFDDEAEDAEDPVETFNVRLGVAMGRVVVVVQG